MDGEDLHLDDMPRAEELPCEPPSETEVMLSESTETPPRGNHSSHDDKGLPDNSDSMASSPPVGRLTPEGTRTSGEPTRDAPVQSSTVDATVTPPSIVVLPTVSEDTAAPKRRRLNSKSSPLGVWASVTPTVGSTRASTVEPDPASSSSHSPDGEQLCGVLAWVSTKTEAEIAAIRFKAHTLLRRYYETNRKPAEATKALGCRERRSLLRTEFSSLDRAALAKAAREMLATSIPMSKEDTNTIRYHYLIRSGKYYKKGRRPPSEVKEVNSKGGMLTYHSDKWTLKRPKWVGWSVSFVTDMLRRDKQVGFIWEQIVVDAETAIAQQCCPEYSLSLELCAKTWLEKESIKLHCHLVVN